MDTEKNKYDYVEYLEYLTVLHSNKYFENERKL